jgi:hypothetical protein
VTETPVADTPSVSDLVLSDQPGDPATLTRLQITATTPGYGTVNQGSDYIQSLTFSGVPSDVTLTGTGLVENPDGTRPPATRADRWISVLTVIGNGCPT